MKNLATCCALLAIAIGTGCRDSGSSKTPPPAEGGLSAAPVTSRSQGSGIAPETSSSPAAAATAAADPVVAAPPPDTQGPTIEVLEPSRGLATPDGMVRLVARVRDAGGVDTVLLNGTAMPLRGDRLEANVPLDAGLNLLEIQAIDGAGNMEQAVVPVLGGQFLPADQRVPQALTVRLNRGVFQRVSDQVERKLGGRALEREVLKANPLVNDSKGLTKLTLNATSFKNGAPSLRLTPSAAGLVARATIPAVKLSSRVKGKAAIVPFRSTVTVSASAAKLAAVAAVSLDRNGNVATRLRDVSVSLENFKLDIKWVPGFLERLARNKVRSTIEKRLTEQLQDELGPAIQTAIAGAIRPIRRRIKGHTIRFDVRPGAVAFDAEGLSLSLNMNLGVVVPDGTQVPASPGSLFEPVVQAPEIKRGASFELSAHTNLLNRIAHTVWQGGLVDLKLDSAGVDALGLSPSLALDAFILTVIFPELTGKVGLPETPARLEVSLGMPPVFNTVGRNRLNLNAGDVTVSVFLTPVGKPEQLVARIGLQLDATLESEIRDKAFHTRIVGMPSAKVDAYEAPLTPLSALGIQNLLDLVLPEALAHQNKLFTGFPLPTVPLVTPKDLKLENDPQSPGYLDLSGNL